MKRLCLKELCLKCPRDWQKRQLMRDKVSRCYELPANLHGALNKHVCCGLFQMVSSFLSLKAYRLHQLRSWGEPEGESQEKYLRNKDFLLGLIFHSPFPNLSSCPLLKVSNYFSISYLCSTPFPFLSVNKSNKVKDDLRQSKKFP